MQNAWMLFLAVYIAQAVVGYVLEYLNLHSLKKYGGQVPEEFSGTIDPARLAKIRDYVLDKNRLALAESVLGQGVTILFIFGGWLPRYAAWVGSWHGSFILSGLAFFLLLLAAPMLWNLPFSWYTSFRIETKYGFNLMTPATWISDQIKSLVLLLVLLGLLLAGGLALVEYFPHTWWLWLWVFFGLYTLVIMYLSPYVLEPLFNKFTPMANERLAAKISGLMEKVSLKVSRVFTMDASRRSKHTNAYFTGLGRVKRIVLYDTLLEKMEDSEILAVLAHELGHWRGNHVLKRLLVSELASLGLLYAAFWLLPGKILTGLFQLPQDDFFAKMVLLGFVFSLLAFFFTPLMSAWSRRQEAAADRMACGLVGSAEPLFRALVKLAHDNLSNLHPHPWYAAFHYSHPPVVRRLQNLRKMESRLKSLDGCNLPAK